MGRTYNCLLVRHPQTEWNRDKRLCGQTDAARWSDLGLTQARDIAESLRGYAIKKIVSSDLNRAAYLAYIIATTLGGPVPVLDERLRELALGELDGLRDDEAVARFTESRLSPYGDGYDLRSIGGEAQADVVERYQAAFHEHVVEEGVCVFVGHGFAFKAFLSSCGVATPVVQGSFVQLLYRKRG